MAGDVGKFSLLLAADASGFLKGLETASTGLRHFEKGATSAVSSIVSGLGKIGLAGMGLQALAGAAKGLGDALGIGLNAELENTRAQLVAFTKSGEQADKILADIRKEASTTPFAFAEMAKATASLLPASKQSGVALMDLVKQAEILAASNPAQGLEGAAFALKEALGGDFVSIVERFNLPRERLNQLKAEGVPAIKAVQTAMKEMGLDTDLVSGLANTATGRWSTLMDTFDTLRATISAPLFEALSGALGELQSVLDANQESFSAAATAAGQFLGALATNGIATLKAVAPMLGLLKDTVLALGSGHGFDQLYSGLIKVFGEDTAAKIAAVIDPIAVFRSEHLPKLVEAVRPVVEWVGTKLPGAFDATMQGVQGLVDMGATTVQFFKDNKLAVDVLQAALVTLTSAGIANLLIALPGLATAFATTAAAAVAAGAAMAIAWAPFILGGVVITGLVLGAKLLLENWEGVKAGAMGLADQIGIMAGQIKEKMGLVFDFLVAPFRNAWETIKGIVDLMKEAWNFVSGGGGGMSGGARPRLVEVRNDEDKWWVDIFDRDEAVALAKEQAAATKEAWARSQEAWQIFLDANANALAAAKIAAAKGLEEFRRDAAIEVSAARAQMAAGDVRLAGKRERRLREFVELFAPERLAKAAAFAGGDNRFFQDALRQIASTLDLNLQIGNVRLGGLLSDLGVSVQLPKFAGGVTNFRGGLALVGERGAELVRLPRGSDVLPLQGSGQAGAGAPLNVTVNLEGATIYGEADFEGRIEAAVQRAVAAGTRRWRMGVT